MGRIRTSTWILTVIFLVAFIAYLFVKPTPAVTVQHAPARREHSVTRTPVPRTPLPGVPSSSPSPHVKASSSPSHSGSPSPSGSPSRSGSPSPSGSPSAPAAAQPASTPAS
jgi:hypothetical protein